MSISRSALVWLASGALAFGLLPECAQAREAERRIEIVGATVIPMDGERVLQDHTVVIEGGRILELGPRSRVALQPGATRIDGSGKFLMPGLADMHAHVRVAAEETVNAELLLYLASGVTLLRNMVGSAAHLALRRKVEEGEIPGPRIFTVSPLLEGQGAVWSFAQQVLDPGKVDFLVAGYAANGYDAVKIYHTLSREVYEAFIAAGRRHRIAIVGHVPFTVGIDSALRAGQSSIEHLRGYDIDGVAAEVLLLDGGRSPQRFASWLAMTDARMHELARATAAAGVWNCPTLVVNDMLADLDRLADLAEHPSAALLPPSIRVALANNPLAPLFSPEARAMLRAVKPQQLKFVKALKDAGAGLLIGTDTMLPFLVPGFTVVDEIANFVQAGLTEFEALRAATAEPAKYLGIANSSGTVEVGKRADLILLDADPLRDVRNLHSPTGVFVQGRWFSREELRARLQELAATSGPGER